MFLQILHDSGDDYQDEASSRRTARSSLLKPSIVCREITANLSWHATCIEVKNGMWLWAWILYNWVFQLLSASYTHVICSMDRPTESLGEVVLRACTFFNPLSPSLSRSWCNFFTNQLMYPPLMCTIMWALPCDYYEDSLVVGEVGTQKHIIPISHTHKAEPYTLQIPTPQIVTWRSSLSDHWIFPLVLDMRCVVHLKMMTNITDKFWFNAWEYCTFTRQLFTSPKLFHIASYSW